MKELDITDCVITIDAIGCQKQIAKQIIDQKGHYCLAVKTNQAILYEEIKEYFSYAEKEEAEKLSTYETLEKIMDGKRLVSGWILSTPFLLYNCS